MHPDDPSFRLLTLAPPLLKPVAALYEDLLHRHGASPEGVGWIADSHQRDRFEVLAALMGAEENLVVNDLGCGYGALFDYLKDKPALRGGHYRGYDISAGMLAAAKARISDPRACFEQALVTTHSAHYSFVSGTFNLRYGSDEFSWTELIKDSLRNLARHSQRGFAFNLLSAYGGEIMPLYYHADPAFWLDFCLKEFSTKVALRHDYGLRDFTISVRF
ncbi:MAG: class I SAM-dependent methyltransferase [Rhodospirillales bacterium]|nr:class I SAM-dependent methyltransferase [Rhodospirillales bacterium]